MFGLFRLSRKLLLFFAIVVLAVAAACFVSVGRLLVDPRAFEPAGEADVIYVLAGADADRWLEGYDLWREQRAPLILLSPGVKDAAGMELLRRGIRVPTGADVARDVLVGQLGVPATAVEVVPEQLDNTAAEAAAIAELAASRGWRRVLVVTSLPHTRRTMFAMRRALDPAGIAVQVRASRYDEFDPSRWWANRSAIRWILSELPKLAAYRLGLGE
ncbi:MAG: YdcF family protein [Acidobacteriota bacterium]|nr:YdcF family protein [Acidobacteriota bacterium]